MTIILFGSTGMLGRYVNNVLSQNYNVITFKREDFDIVNDNWNKLYELFDYNKYEQRIIINCAGTIPQNIHQLKPEYSKYIRANTLFPHKLQEIAERYNYKFIHITTDCVFDGLKDNGLYVESDPHTETNIYGVSKSLGEHKNACIIRTSIIGEELLNRKSLLEWTRRQKNKTINGYINHRWNGVTCLTLANLIKQIIDTNRFWTGARHIFSPNTVSKYELCQFINEIYELNININKFETKDKCDKSLASLYVNDWYMIEDIKTQIVKQKNYQF